MSIKQGIKLALVLDTSLDYLLGRSSCPLPYPRIAGVYEQHLPHGHPPKTNK